MTLTVKSPYDIKLLNTEVNKISGNQGGLASNEFSANEVPAVEQTGALSFFRGAVHLLISSFEAGAVHLQISSSSGE